MIRIGLQGILITSAILFHEGYLQFIFLYYQIVLTVYNLYVSVTTWTPRPGTLTKVGFTCLFPKTGLKGYVEGKVVVKFHLLQGP